jgi:hypothetical protein
LISKDGNVLTFKQKIPDRFLDMERHFIYYNHQNGIIGTKQTNTTMLIQKGNEATQDVHESFKMQPVLVPTVVKLPYPVQQQFSDPYHQAGFPGYELVCYPHESDATRFFYVYSVSVIDAAMPQVNTQTNFRVGMWGQGPPPQQGPPQQGQPANQGQGQANQQPGNQGQHPQPQNNNMQP